MKTKEIKIVCTRYDNVDGVPTLTAETPMGPVVFANECARFKGNHNGIPVSWSACIVRNSNFSGVTRSARVIGGREDRIYPRDLTPTQLSQAYNLALRLDDIASADQQFQRDLAKYKRDKQTAWLRAAINDHKSAIIKLEAELDELLQVKDL